MAQQTEACVLRADPLHSGIWSERPERWKSWGWWASQGLGHESGSGCVCAHMRAPSCCTRVYTCACVCSGVACASVRVCVYMPWYTVHSSLCLHFCVHTPVSVCARVGLRVSLHTYVSVCSCAQAHVWGLCFLLRSGRACDSSSCIRGIPAIPGPGLGSPGKTVPSGRDGECCLLW